MKDSDVPLLIKEAFSALEHSGTILQKHFVPGNPASDVDAIQGIAIRNLLLVTNFLAERLGITDSKEVS